MNLKKHDALIVGINKIMASANEEQKDAENYDEMSFQSGIIATCIDLKYQIEHGVWKKVPNLKEHIQYEYGSYKEMAEKADRVNSWKRYYRGKAKGYKMIVDLL